MVARYCTLMALLLPALSVHAAPSVPEGYRQVAQQARVPAELLYAVALTESGSRLPQGIRPWPWTLNVAGRGYRYATRSDACAALQRFVLTTHPKRIDVGPGQINLGWHGQHFATPCDALAPYPNLRLAAQLLRSHYDRWQSWTEAAGRYHHPAGGKPAQRYRTLVLRHLQNLPS
ncbi:transglycosylase [Salmonella enterica subsp. enterica serovar Redlands]|nr:transglycosylase [Salmonella enterica subsp. enterica serovar Redlands]